MNRFAILISLLLFCIPTFAWNWSFPKDHGMHPTFDSEWVYVTGHLTDSAGSLHGFQVTFFRHKLTPVPDGTSPWNSPHLYTAHFAFTNGNTGEFNHYETMGRENPSKAYGKRSQLNVFIRDWKINMKENKMTIDIRAGEGHFKLFLTPTKPIVFHGDNGKSYKSSQKNYSYYYSMTRLEGHGSYTTKSETYSFTSASAWMDREFFNNLLDSKQVGWDWFSLQLDSGDDIMVFQVRSTDGTTYKSGTFVSKDGTTESIPGKDIELTPKAYWVSEKSQHCYPIEWQINLPSLNQSFTITARFQNQELFNSIPFPFFYWEGQTLVSGSQSGRAYLEMVGY